MTYKTAVTDAPKNSSSAWTAAGLTLLFTLLFGGAAYFQYRAFGYWDFDLALYVQSIHNLTHGVLDCSILGIRWIGNHAHWILAPIAPVFALAPTPLTLLWVQTLALALAAWPIYRLATLEFGHDRFAPIFVMAYLFYVPVGHVALFEFHSVAIATPLLLAQYYCGRVGRNGWFAVWGLLAASCQEDVTLLVAMICFHRLWSQRKSLTSPDRIVTAGVGTLALGWFAIFLFVISPLYGLQDNVSLISIYSQFGNSTGEIIRNFFLRPDIVLDSLTRAAALLFLLKVLAPLLFLPLLAPDLLWMALPWFGLHLLSTRETEQSIRFHYTATLTPFIIIAAITGARRLLSWPRLARFEDKVTGALILAICISFYVVGVPVRFRKTPEQFSPTAFTAEKERWLARIPADASVLTTFESMARLAKRRECYSMGALIEGRKILSNEPINPIPQTDYAVIDFYDQMVFGEFYRPAMRLPNGTILPASEIALRRYFAALDWRCVTWVNSFAILSRKEPPAFTVTGSWTTVVSNQTVIIDRQDLTNDRLQLRFRWPSPPTVPYWVRVDLTSPNLPLPIAIRRGPAQLLGQTEEFWILNLADLAPDDYSIQLSLYNRLAFIEAITGQLGAKQFKADHVYPLGLVRVGFEPPVKHEP